MMKLSFDGQGSGGKLWRDVQRQDVAYQPRCEPCPHVARAWRPPRLSAGVPLALHADIVKQISSIDLNAVTGDGGRPAGHGERPFRYQRSQDAIHHRGERRLRVAALSARRSSGLAAHALDRGNARRNRRRRLCAFGPRAASRSAFWTRRKAISRLPPRRFLLARRSRSWAQPSPPRSTSGDSPSPISMAVCLAARLLPRGGLWPRGAGAELDAKAELKGGKLDEASLALLGRDLARGPFDFAFSVQGEGLSPPGLVAGLDGKGSLSLGAGALQTLRSGAACEKLLSPPPRKRSRSTRRRLPQRPGRCATPSPRASTNTPPTQFTFEVKNGTVRLAPATLSTAGAANQGEFLSRACESQDR